MYQLDDEGFIKRRKLDDGRWLFVMPYSYGQAHFGISMAPPLERVGVFADFWIFPNVDSALIALDQWDGIGEPNGWYRHHATARRRPNGDPALEYIQE